MKKLNLAQFLLLAILFLSACKNDLPDFSNTTLITNPGGTSGGITSEYYFKGTLNGQTINWQAAPDGAPGYVTGSASAISLDKGIVTGSLEALVSKTTGLQPQLGIQFEIFKVDLSQNVAAYFTGFVSTGAWVFNTSPTGTTAPKEITIFYTDASGKTYQSTGPQTGGVTVISVSPVSPELGNNEGLKIKLTFSCTLYPADLTGNPLSLNNAEATVFLEDLLH